MLTKLIDTSSYYRSDEPQVTVINFSNVKGLTKQAADSRVTEYVSTLSPESNKIYIHILAMGAGEYFGANRNSDFFPESNLIDYFKTFETSPAHVFRNHVNKDPTIAIGKVIFAVYNERMHRVELIAEVDKDRGRDIVERLANGDFPATSMACKTPFDVCAVCGNKASTRQDYCTHLSEELGRVYPDGKKVMALNVGPLKFFDISIVVRPADVTSSILQKVASVDEHVTGSVDAATMAGLTEAFGEKTAALKKFSEFIKELDGNIVDSDPNLSVILDKVKDPEYKIIDVLKNYKLNDVFSTMGHMGITPSVGFLAELIAQKHLGPEGVGLGSAVASCLSNTGVSSLPMFDSGFGDVSEPSLGVANALLPYIVGSSFLPEFVEDRAAMSKTAFENDYRMGTNIGYVGNGPYLEPTPEERMSGKPAYIAPPETSNLLASLHTLLSIGSVALAAKWYITQVIEKKMKEAERNKAQDGVKIVLVKSASDYKTTYRLAKAAMIRLVQKKH